MFDLVAISSLGLRQK